MALPIGPPENIANTEDAHKWMNNLYNWLISPESSDGPNFLQSGTGSTTRTVQNRLRDTVSVKDFGAVGDGTTDDSTAFQNAINTGKEVIVPGADGTTEYKITTPLTAVTGMVLTGYGRPTLKASVNGKHVLSGASLSDLTIRGIKFEGTGSATTPSVQVGGYAATSTGLVTFATCTDIHIDRCEFYNFYNGFSAIACDRVWFCKNRVRNWLVYGVLLSVSTFYTVEHNSIVGCDQTEATNAYGIMGTGDDVTGSISFNEIADIVPWDGIMAHACKNIRIIGNEIRNVRLGIDICIIDTNTMKNVVIIGNTIKATTTDAFDGEAGGHSGIEVAGASADNSLEKLVIMGNTIEDFYTMTGCVLSGNSADISVAYASRASIVGNVIRNSGSQAAHPGIYVIGTTNGLCISGNTLQGTFASGGIYLLNLTSDGASINGNVIKQETTSDYGIYLSGCTITSLAVSGNASNSDAGKQYYFASCTMTTDSTDFAYSASATYDPPSLDDGAGTATNVTCTGAVVGDFAVASFGADLQSITMTAYVSQSDTVTVRFQNETGGTVDLGSSTLRVRVTPRTL